METILQNLGYWPNLKKILCDERFWRCLTMLGVVIGAYVAKILLPIIIIIAALSGSIAMGISGMSGAYMTEKAERTKELKELERAMVTDLTRDSS